MHGEIVLLTTCGRSATLTKLELLIQKVAEGITMKPIRAILVLGFFVGCSSSADVD